MLDVTLWVLSVWGLFAAKRGSCWWFLCKRIPKKTETPDMWNEKQCLITVFIICSGRQLILYYDTHRLFFVSNHLTILLQAIAKVLHFCSFSSFPMEITSSEYWLWYSRLFSVVIPVVLQRRPGIQANCLNYCIQFDLESGSLIRSGMTKEIFFNKSWIIRTCS